MLRILKNSAVIYKPCSACVRDFKTTSSLNEFWEPDEKGGYGKQSKVSQTQLIRDGFKELKHEIALWAKEVKEHFENDPIMFYRPNETDVIWRFDKPESLNNWIVSCDRDHNEGHSTCSLTLNKMGKGLFSGELNVTVPKDGQIKRTGYCNIRTLRARKSFKRQSFLDWSPYNFMVLKVRGDGRSYMLNIHCKGFFDLSWNDTYHFPLYTRGGPYWQITKIPFSRFFYASKGRIQDRQYNLSSKRVTSFGITMADKINGNFSLEIDYIGLEFDPSHTEESAYETYKTEPNIAGG